MYKRQKEIPHGFYGDEPAGIWQPVKLSITDPTKVEDVFIKPTLNGATFDVTLKNYDNKQKEFNLYTDIIDKETGAVLYSGLSIRKLRLNTGEERIETLSLIHIFRKQMDRSYTDASTMYNRSLFYRYVESAFPGQAGEQDPLPSNITEQDLSLIHIFRLCRHRIER